MSRRVYKALKDLKGEPDKKPDDLIDLDKTKEIKDDKKIPELVKEASSNT